MPLIVSVSGIRGTIGGRPGEGLTPDDVVAFCSGYAELLKQHKRGARVVVGRDGRASGPLIAELVRRTLVSHGVDVIDVGTAPTPTVAMAVPHFNAEGGIIITASHNPEEWNALKLLDARGEFISPSEGVKVAEFARHRTYRYAAASEWGTIASEDALTHHVEAILAHPLVRADAVRRRRFRVVVDAINSVGGAAFAALFEALGVDVEIINAEITGHFTHNPEPLPAHLRELSEAVIRRNAHLGLAVDPDADRLVLVDEQGQFPGEEYTLVLVADYVLRHEPGPTVSNTASTSALRVITERYGQRYYESPVGEWHVVQKMKEVSATIGGEGNGGIIDPRLHYGRDALIGAALILSHMAESNEPLSEWRRRMPHFVMTKEKIPLAHPRQADELIERLEAAFGSTHSTSRLDGLKIFFSDGWVLLRKSNTEPIIRLIAEATDASTLRQYIDTVQRHITSTP